MNFCPRCGTKVTGNFCRSCGASTAIEPTIHVVPSPLETSPEVASESLRETSRYDEGPHQRTSWFTRHSDQQGVTVLPQGRTRRLLAWETRLVMFAFLVTGVTSAVVILAQHESGVADISRFPTIVHSSQVLNMLLGMLAYFPVIAVVPLALFLLARTGQTPSVLGLGAPNLKRDLFPALGIGLAAFTVEVLLFAPFAGLVKHHRQTTFGISRDDINNFLPAYLKLGIFKQDPFATLDQAGVGLLVKMATAKGRNTRPNLKVGICGEHGGDPESVKFCHKIGLNYVSCSPFRLLTARLAAAQAALQEIQTGPDIHSGTC